MLKYIKCDKMSAFEGYYIIGMIVIATLVFGLIGGIGYNVIKFLTFGNPFLAYVGSILIVGLACLLFNK